MSNVIDNITLIKLLGKGSFGEVYLSTKKGKNEYFATKKISRAQADQPSVRKYFENEIRLLNTLKHPNIVKFEEIKATKDYYYIVMEYINGGSLSDCLKKYKDRTGKPFPEVIVQYLMRQIVDAIKYIHGLKIIHRDLKLDNIMVSFSNDMDKNNLNMMNAQVKIIDFGLAIHLTKNSMAFSALGSPMNMDPTILRKFSKKGGNLNQLGYDSKADIWSLGTLCYEMLIGEAVFNAESMNDLVKKVENGSYTVPTSLSKEVVSFLNGMLQYDGNYRLSSEELSRHPFLTKRINEFTRIDINKVSKKIDNKGLNINVKQNKTIWAIFNEEDEKKLLNIKGKNDLPAPLGPIPEEYPEQRSKRSYTEKNMQRFPVKPDDGVNRNYQKANTQYQYPTFHSVNQQNIYGQNMGPNIGGINQFQRMPPAFSGMAPMPAIPPLPGIPSMQMPGMAPMPGVPQMPNYSTPPRMNFPTFSPMVQNNSYSYGGGIYSPNNSGMPPMYGTVGIGTNPNVMNQYAPLNNDEDMKEDVCIIM